MYNNLLSFIKNDQTSGSDLANIVYNVIPGEVNSLNNINFFIRFTIGNLIGDSSLRNYICISICNRRHIYLSGGKSTNVSSDRNCSLHALDRLFKGMFRKLSKFKNTFLQDMRSRFNIDINGISYKKFKEVYETALIMYETGELQTLSSEEKALVISKAGKCADEWVEIFKREFNPDANLLSLGGSLSSSALSPINLYEFMTNNTEIIVFYNSHMFYVYDVKLFVSNQSGRINDIYNMNYNISTFEDAMRFWAIGKEEINTLIPNAIEEMDDNKSKRVSTDFDYHKNITQRKRNIYEVNIDKYNITSLSLTSIMKDVALTSPDRFSDTKEPKFKKYGLIFFDVETFMDRSLIHNNKCIIRDTILYARVINPEDITELDNIDFKTLESIQKLQDLSTNLYFQTEIGPDGNYITAARKFIDWLNDNPHKYYIYSHNGANFDHYFILNVLNYNELSYAIQQGILCSGSGFLSFTLKNGTFRDSAKFLLGSLSSIAKKYFPNIPSLWKTDNAIFYNPETDAMTSLDSVQLCFYKSSRKMIDDSAYSFNDFITILPNEQSLILPEYIDEKNRHVFWDVYKMYCDQDVLVLSAIWIAYRNRCRDMDSQMIENEQKINTSIRCLPSFMTPQKQTEYFTNMSLKMHVDNCMTIGNHSMTRLKVLKDKCKYFKLFNDANDNTPEIYRLINRAKIGGMSISNIRGHINEKVIAYDVKSLYPAALMYGWYPGGKPYYKDRSDFSDDTTKSIKEQIDLGLPAMIRMKNMIFTNTNDNKLRTKRVFRPNKSNMFGSINGGDDYIDLMYRPILEQDPLQLRKMRNYLCLSENERTWLSESNIIHETTCSSMMVMYLKKSFGLVSYDIEEICIWEKWIPGKYIFDSIIGVAYAAKQKEDDYLESNHPDYNPVTREASKLTMNSLTGKLGQTKHGRKNMYLSDDKEMIDNISPLDKLRSNNLIVHDNTSNKKIKTSFEYESIPDAFVSSEFTIHMIMIYEMSKNMLVNYLTALYRIKADFFAIETDSIHLSRKYQERYETIINNQNSDIRHMTYKVNPVYYESLRGQSLKLFSHFRAGKDVKELGQLAVDKLGDQAYYIGKKKYAIIQVKNDTLKADCRLAGFKASTIRYDGSSLDLISIKTYMKILQNSVIFRKKLIEKLNETILSDDFILTPEYKLFSTYRNEYKVSQYVSNLVKDKNRLTILQSKAQKSVSPIFSTHIDRCFNEYTNIEEIDIIGDVLENNETIINDITNIQFDGSR